jgi:uncharacterized membrane protein
MSDSTFELLFKFSPYIFQQGTFVLSAAWPSMLLAVVLLVGGLLAVLRYRKVGGKSRPVDRVLLASVRTLVLLILLLCLMQPALVVSTAVPQENFVGILIDDSQSMQIADRDELPRSEFVSQAFGAEGSELLEALSEDFNLRFFRFSDVLERVDGVESLTYAGHQTYLATALEGARQELASVPLSGLILVSDGADNALGGISDSVQSLRAASVPVFPVGLGVERFSRDIEISRVEVPRTVLAGSSVGVDVVIEHKGFGGAEIVLIVEDDNGIVSTQDVTLPRQGDSTVVKASFTAEEAGPRVFRVRIAPQEGEMVAQNNQRDVLVSVQDRADRILYYEGMPRHDVAFLRRALSEDHNLQLTVLQGTAENKFLRLDIVDEDELFGGFPRSREELYQYRGLILGNVQAHLLTSDQQRMVADFVSQRGGGLLMIGGHSSFAEGGYAGSPIAEVLPVVLSEVQLEDEATSPAYSAAEIQIQPTLFGMTHPVIQLADTLEESQERWRHLPPLTVINRIFSVKPGAVTLLTGTAETLPSPQIVLAHQRYGRGSALAFAPQDSWLWQMHHDIPLEDMTHETLWRQLLRWLVQDVPGQVELTTSRDRYAPEQPVRVTASVRDETYIELNDSQVTARVISPAGLEDELPMDWSLDADGEYLTQFTPLELGFYEIHVEARRNGDLLGLETSHIEVADLSSEHFDAEMRAPLLQRIAEETGGHFYTPETVSALPEDIGHSDGGTTVLEVMDLWDMPILFLSLVLLIGIEWVYRKLRGLA